MIRNLDLGHSIGRMGGNIREDGRLGDSMERVHLQQPPGRKGKVSGKTEKG